MLRISAATAVSVLPGFIAAGVPSFLHILKLRWRGIIGRVCFDGCESSSDGIAQATRKWGCRIVFSTHLGWLLKHKARFIAYIIFVYITWAYYVGRQVGGHQLIHRRYHPFSHHFLEIYLVSATLHNSDLLCDSFPSLQLMLSSSKVMSIGIPVWR